MAIDCNKLTELSENARKNSLMKVNTWLEGRKQSLGETMVRRAEAGHGDASISLPAYQILGLSPSKETAPLIVSVCKQAVADFVGEEAGFEAWMTNGNVTVNIIWKKYT